MNQAEIITTYRNEAGTSTVKTETLEADLSFNIERTAMDAASSAIEFDISIPVAKIKAFAISCKKTSGIGTNDGTVSLTVNTNDNATPGNSFTITPTNGIGWSTGDLPTTVCPLTTDVTKIFVTANTPSSGPAAKFDFTFRALVDSTPGLAD